jgi:hypothetical protein
VGPPRGRASGRLGAQNDHLDARVARDGKRYPADAGATPDRILMSLRKAPKASLRQIDEVTGSQPATVRDVKASLSLSGLGDDVVDSGAQLTTSRSSDRWVTDAGFPPTVKGEVFTAWFERASEPHR